MWRIWNCIPRVLRQQFHGPRASAGVYVEEEKAEHEVEKQFNECINSCHGNKDLDTSLLCVQSCCEQGPEGKGQKGGAHQERGDWWKRYCHENFWSRFCSSHTTLDAVTWGAAVVLGLQLSRRPNLHNCIEDLKDQKKSQQWKGLLIRMAFAMPPDANLSVRKSIVQQEDAESASVKSQKKAQDKQSAETPEDKRTLDDIMQDFEASCRQYAAVGSSVSGVSAAEQGRMTAAVEHLTLACQLGHAPACFNLALCHQMGLGVKKDQKQAASCYSKAAKSGHAQAIFNLALMTLRGEGGLVKDRAKAIKLLNTAAQQGLAQAQTYLGVYYTEDDDKQQDFEQAASFFQAAASQNDAEGQYFLGICYENGWGVESSDEEAARLYSAAAELGHDGAMYNLAAFHEYGLGGVRCDEEEAMSLYRRSAELGNESAKFRVQEVEAKRIVDQWSEQNGNSSPVQSPGLRRNPHSSSPTLTDYVRENIASIWVGGLTAWSSMQTVRTSSAAEDSPVTFRVGDGPASQESYTANQHSLVTDVNYNFLNLPQQAHAPHSCVAGMHRTSTMPELRVIPCQ